MIEYIQSNAATIATIFFFLFFCSVVYSVFKKGQKKKFDDYSQIPLRDEELKTKKAPTKTNKSKSNSVKK